MSVESDFYSAMVGNGSVTALVATRIYPDVLPEECVYPAIVFSRARTDRIVSVSGNFFGADVDIAVGCWAKTRAVADAVAAAALAALPSDAWTTPGPDAAYDPETGLYATLLTFTTLSAIG